MLYTVFFLDFFIRFFFVINCTISLMTKQKRLCLQYFVITGMLDRTPILILWQNKPEWMDYVVTEFKVYVYMYLNFLLFTSYMYIYVYIYIYVRIFLVCVCVCV